MSVRSEQSPYPRARVSTVIFDLDGTLLDTLEDIANAMNGALARYGFPRHPLANYGQFVGDGVTALARRALPEQQRAEGTVQSLTDTMHDIYAQNWAVKTKPYAGIPEVLAQLKQLAIRTAVLSNKPHQMTRLAVARFFPGHPFERVYGAGPVPVKPDPTGVRRIMTEMGIAPTQVVYVGDTNTDMITARSAGLTAVGVRWGFRSVAELRASGADPHHRPSRGTAGIANHKCSIGTGALTRLSDSSVSGATMGNWDACQQPPGHDTIGPA